ncbi:MAG: VacJ family lipoprotein [Proteobacteria bacterium]|nr:VacJ family lipoprotein [Pseudomonadota bacterium]
MNNISLKHKIISLILIFSFGLLGGCSTAPSKEDYAGAPDRLELANRGFFNFNEALDKHLLKPISKTYAEFTPQLVRTSITNFFDNIAYLNVILNSFLQGKIDQGLSDSVRLLFNSTIGIGGLFDVATPMGLPEHNEDFGQTLAVWGINRGSYLYLPVLGPNTIRNTPDLASSTLLNPLTYVTGAIFFPLLAINIINLRADLLDETSIRDEAAVDLYSFTREAYLQRREFLIYDGNPPLIDYEAMFEDELEDDSVLIIE